MARAGGMPLWKYVANRRADPIENRLLGTGLSELQPGTAPTPASSSSACPSCATPRLLVRLRDAHAAAHFGFRIAEVPAHTRYFSDASSVALRQSVVYGTKTLWVGRGWCSTVRGIIRSRRFEP